MNKLLICLFSALALALPLGVQAQNTAPSAPANAASPDQASTPDKAKKKQKKKKHKKKKAKKAAPV